MLVLVFIDVDDLKQVNDSRGHLAGDALLQLVGETLRANIRPYDMAATSSSVGCPNLNRIESQTDTEATLVMKGHRRWFGMVGGNTETRQITSVDEQGRTRTQCPE